MNFICLKEYLQKAVVGAERICGKPTTLQILQYILIHTEKGKIELTATNLEQGVRYRLPGKIQTEGRATIPIHVFSQFIQYLPNDKIEIALKNKTLIVRSKNFHVSIQTLPPDDFPIFPTFPQNTTSFSLPSSILTTGLNHTLPIVAISDTRPELSGVFIFGEQKKFFCVATDTFRLGEYTIAANNETFKKFSCIIPQKAAQDITRIFTQNEENLTISLTKQQLFIQTENTEFITRTIEGAYPSYESIIPRDAKNKITINRKELIEQLMAVGTFAGRLQDVRVSADSKNQHLILKTQNEGIGESESAVPAEVSGEDQTLVFNWRYLNDGLQQFSSNQIEWWLNDPSSPSLLRDPEQRTTEPIFQYVLMPIRL